MLGHTILTPSRLWQMTYKLLWLGSSFPHLVWLRKTSVSFLAKTWSSNQSYYMMSEKLVKCDKKYLSFLNQKHLTNNQAKPESHFSLFVSYDKQMPTLVVFLATILLVHSIYRLWRWLVFAWEPDWPCVPDFAGPCSSYHPIEFLSHSRLKLEILK